MVLVGRRPQRARQHDTAVVPAHRSHGLGLWIKSAMLVALRAEQPDVTGIGDRQLDRQPAHAADQPATRLRTLAGAQQLAGRRAGAQRPARLKVRAPASAIMPTVRRRPTPHWVMRWSPALNAFAIAFARQSSPAASTSPTAGYTVGICGGSRVV